MSSAEVRINTVDDAVTLWQNFLPSALSHHGTSCCATAKEWILSLDKSFLVDENTTRAPFWVRLRYEWGPNSWPLYWCELAKKKSIDCGGLAAVSREIFLARGLNALQVQLVEEFTEQDALQWKKKWTNEGYVPNWVLEPYVYHEACALVGNDNHVTIWDPTDNAWIDPDKTTGYSSTQAVRISSYDTTMPQSVVWGQYTIPLNRWVKLIQPNI